MIRWWDKWNEDKDKNSNNNDNKNNNNMIQNKNISGIICKVLLIFLKVSLLVVSFYLFYIGSRYSYHSAKDYDQYMYLVHDSMFIHFLIFAVICIFIVLLFEVYKFIKAHRISWISGENFCKIVLFLLCALLVIVEFFYIREHPYYPSGDQLNTTAGAAYAREGNFLMFSKGGYIGLYEQQKGLLLLYELIFSLFGDFRYDIAARFHLCLSIITLVSGYSFLKIVMKRPIYRILYCIVMVLCIPCIIYLPYAYGDLPSICFSIVLFWALAAYGQRLQKRYIICGSIMAAFALLMRMNIWIVLIAVGIGMVLLSLEKKTLRPILAGVCILLVAEGTVKCVDKMYEYRSGYESGVGIPYILWIAMGLQETDGNPGIYNRYQQSVFEQCNFEQKSAEQIGKKYIVERLEEFKENPAYARFFFTTKLKMQWTDPLFEGLSSTNTFKEGNMVPDLIEDLYYGDFHDIVWNIANYYQSVIYLSFFLFMLFSVKKYKNIMDSVGWIPLIAVMGGFLFSIIWENKSRYVFPYFVYLILYAPIGIGLIVEEIKVFRHHFLANKE